MVDSNNPIIDSFRFMRKYIVSLVMFSFPLFAISVLTVLIVRFSGSETIFFLHFVIKLLIYPFLGAGLLVLISYLSEGRTATTEEILKAVLPFWKYYLITSFAVALFIMVGLMALILPGLWLFFRLMFAQTIIVFEKCVPMDAITRSFTRTGPNLLILASSVLPVLLISFAVYFGLFSYAGITMGPKGLTGPQISVPMSLLLQLVDYTILVYISVLQYRLYQLYGQKPA